MAKLFYTLEQAKAALGQSEDYIHSLVRKRELHESRIGPALADLRYWAEQVEALKAKEQASHSPQEPRVRGADQQTFGQCELPIAGDPKVDEQTKPGVNVVRQDDGRADIVLPWLKRYGMSLYFSLLGLVLIVTLPNFFVEGWLRWSLVVLLYFAGMAGAMAGAYFVRTFLKVLFAWLWEHRLAAFVSFMVVLAVWLAVFFQLALFFQISMFIQLMLLDVIVVITCICWLEKALLPRYRKEVFWVAVLEGFIAFLYIEVACSITPAVLPYDGWELPLFLIKWNWPLIIIALMELFDRRNQDLKKALNREDPRATQPSVPPMIHRRGGLDFLSIPEDPEKIAALPLFRLYFRSLPDQMREYYESLPLSEQVRAFKLWKAGYQKQYAQEEEEAARMKLREDADRMKLREEASRKEAEVAARRVSSYP